MFKFILPIIFVGVAITGFFILTNPLYREILEEKKQIASYGEALNNSKALEAERDKLTQKYNSFNPEDISRLQKLLPDSVDNIRLILEIEKLASPYGMVLKDVKYNVLAKDAALLQAAVIKGGKNLLGKNYSVWDLEFSAQGTYNNFLSFVKDLENNLRIVDIHSVQFSSAGNTGLNPSVPVAYKYSFKIKTYWLKN